MRFGLPLKAITGTIERKKVQSLPHVHTDFPFPKGYLLIVLLLN